MELYLRWLDKYERKPGEEAPLGMILCAGKKQEQIELLEMGRSGIHVAEYLTALPPKELLQAKLHKAIALARKRLEGQNEDPLGAPHPSAAVPPKPPRKSRSGERRSQEERLAENMGKLMEAE
jgi:hypothetical protein